MAGAFGSVLVANRGEIARRVFRTCREMGLGTVAVFSDPDADATFVAEADRAVGLGGAAPADSYLRIDTVLEAAAQTGAEAVHPGYGFLSENADFARAVDDAGLTWIGPSADIIAAMGSKTRAKRLMAEAGVPLLPGAELDGLTEAEMAAAGEDLGFPLLVKASSGGGGRGMRVVAAADELAEAVVAARREAESAFGDGSLFIERYVSPSRHVEVQIVGDDHGRVVHLHERDCSVQRRHQKIIEEAPAPTLDEAVRAGLHAAAVRAGKAIGYTNAGTVEFLLAPTGEFFFLEVNTRLQVEHPVTEAVLGLDLVRLQLEVAAGRPLPEQPDLPTPSGHAIEARIYAEDPTAGFRPSTGLIHAFATPDTVRVDTALAPDGGVVSRHYDPMIAKIVAHRPTRDDAARALSSALRGTTVAGVTTNLGLLARTLEHAEFLGADGDTGFLERHDPAEIGRPPVEGAERARALLAVALADQAEHRAAATINPAVASGFRNVATEPQRSRYLIQGERGDGRGDADDGVEVTYRFRRGALVDCTVDGEALVGVRLWPSDTADSGIDVDGVRGAADSDGRTKLDEVDLTIDGVRTRHRVGRSGDVRWVTGPTGVMTVRRLPRFSQPEDAVEAGSLVASMPGTVRAVPVAVGDRVEAGDTVVVMEAMKMELTLTAPTAGTVTQIDVAVDDAVETGTLLAVINET
jgi:acetyl/propionyl-CoA carboxylase alpha subunit